MKTGSKMTDDELRLNTDTNPETVRRITLFQIGLLEIRDRRLRIGRRKVFIYTAIIAVVERIDTGSETENADRNPVCCRFECGNTEELHLRIVIAVIILLDTSGGTNLYRPRLVHLFAELFGRLSFVVSRWSLVVSRMIAHT